MIDLKRKPIAIFAGFFIFSRLGGENSPHIDEIVGDHSESDPSVHAILTSIATSIQSMPAFQNADSALTTCSPLLTLSKPPRLLNLPKSKILGRTIGNGNVSDAHLPDSDFVRWRMKRCVSRYQVGNLSEPLTMLLDSLHQ